MSDEILQYNIVKRERMRKMEIRDKIAEMRKNLPVHTLEEIREHKMPYYDALVTNLEENGYMSSAHFVKQLVEFQTKAREEAGPGSNIWMRPQLCFSKKELKHLVDELQKAEAANTAENYTKECDTILRLGIYFAFLHPDWWWLGEQLLVQSINVSGGYTFLQGNYEALSRYAYAKFLITNLKEYENAKEQLLEAKDLCQNKGQNIETYFPDEKGTLYMQINYYSYKCLIKDARTWIPQDYKKAIETAVQAKKRAAEACYKEGETHALLLKGLCEMNTDKAKIAILSFNKARKLQETKENKEGLCKVLIQLAKAYLMDNNTSQSLRVLNSLKDTAAKYELHFYLAEAYKNMGEYYLNNREYAVARKLLNKSLNLFEREPNASSDIALVQILEAIAWGLELFPKYSELVFNAGYTAGSLGTENLNSLLEWKDSRVPFWQESTEIANRSFVDMMAADNQTVRPSTIRIEQYREQRRLIRMQETQTGEQQDKTTETNEYLENEEYLMGENKNVIIEKEVDEITDTVDNEKEVNEVAGNIDNEKKEADGVTAENNNQTRVPESKRLIELHKNLNTSISEESVNVIGNDQEAVPPNFAKFKSIE